MKRLVAGLALGVVTGAAGTAGASALKDAYLDRGDRAFAVGGATACTVLPHGGSRNGFVCQVGGDYRARYGVIVNEREVAITRFTSFARYSVLVRREQSTLP